MVTGWGRGSAVMNPRLVPDSGRGGQGIPLPAGGRRRLRSCIALFLLSLQFAGCFRYVPITSAAPTGAQVSLAINDAGRIALAEQIGPGVRRIHGQLREPTDSVIVVSLTSVEYFDLSAAARMAGERAEIPRRYVSEFRERRLSRSRTFLTAALVVAGLAAATLIGISGFGADDPGDRPGGDGGSSQ